MKTLKRLLITLTLAMLCIGALTLSVFAAEEIASGTCGAEGDNLTWVLDSDYTLTISGTGDMADYRSTSMPWSSYKTELEALIVEEGVTSIGSYAFYYCTSLTSVTIPDGVTVLGNDAFADCFKLASVTLSEGLEDIGDKAFSRCECLASIVIPEGVKTIGMQTFIDCTSLTSVSLPESLTNIGSGAFWSCHELASVAIPDGVTVIENGAFQVCRGLTSVELPDTLTAIEDGAFNGCSSLTSITIPAAVTSIGTAAFMGCSSMTEILVAPDNAAYSSDSMGVLFNKDQSTLIVFPAGISGSYTIPSNVTSVSERSFAGCSLTEVTIPGSMETTGENTFSECPNLTTVIISSGVKDIGAKAFYKCPSLTTVDISSTVTCINTEAFYGCTGLKEFTVPGNVAKIDSYAFAQCTQISTLTLLPGVEIIGTGAFQKCAALSHIILPSSVTTVNSESFDYTYPTAVCYLGSESEWAAMVISGNSTFLAAPVYYNWQLGDPIPGLKILDSGTCGSSVAWKLDETGLLTVFGKGAMATTSPICPAHIHRSQISTVVIESGVTSIGNNAFYGYAELTSITIPKTVTGIGYCAFAECTSLTSFEIPERVTSLGNRVFDGCTSLAYVSIPASLRSTGQYVFNNCTGLQSITVDPDNAYFSSDSYGVLFNKDKTTLIKYTSGVSGSYVIPQGVTTIGTYAFDSSAGLTGVTIPNTVEILESHAFSKCNGLTEVTLPDSVTTLKTYAFSWCRNLKSMTFTPSLKTISDAATNGCSALTDVYYTGTESDWAAIYIATYNTRLKNANIHYNYQLEPELVQPTVTAKYPGLAFEEEIYYNVYFALENPDNVEILEVGLLTWTSPVDGDVTNAECVCPGAVLEGDYWKTRSQAISAKNMGEELYFKVYAKLESGAYVYSVMRNYSAKSYCENKLAGSSDMALKSMCVALMNYGAAAQEYFDYKTDELMNAGLTQEQQALAAPYSDDMIPALTSVGAKGDALKNNGGYSKRFPSVTFGGALAINYNFTPANAPENGMKLYVWTEADVASVDALTLENASRVVEMTVNGDLYVDQVSGIAAKNAGDTYFVCGVYESNGTTYYTGVLAYSVSTYCKSYANNSGSTAQSLASTAAIYAYYADAYMN